MRNIFAFTSVVASLLFAVSSFTFAQDSPSADAVASVRGVQALETRAVFYPQELAFGDVGYFASFWRNLSDEPIMTPRYELDLEKAKEGGYKGFHMGVRAKFLQGDAETPSVQMLPIELAVFTPDYTERPGRRDDLPPGVEGLGFFVANEFPPLEDWEKPFWVKVREQLASVGSVELTLFIVYETSTEAPCSFASSAPSFRRQTSSQFTWNYPIVLKNRPKKELELLTRWYDARKEARWFYPINLQHGPDQNVKFSVTFPQNLRGISSSNERHELKCESPRAFIRVGDNTYEPWNFIRVGNRKPSDPNNPTDVDGWRNLEAAFAPSTLRDEITLTRLQLEYYDADEGEESDAALKALGDWLSQRPEPQRLVLAGSLCSKRGKFQGTPLEAKNATLCDALTSAFPVETPTTDDAK